MASTLEICLKGLKQRHKKNKSPLLLSLIEPHKLAVSSTISGWIEKVLKESGVNTAISKVIPHVQHHHQEQGCCGLKYEVRMKYSILRRNYKTKFENYKRVRSARIVT